MPTHRGRPFPHPFHPKPWLEIIEFLDWIADLHPTIAHMPAIARSVVDGGATELLAGSTSMHDLLVTSTPVSSETPQPVIHVRAPSSSQRPDPGCVVIEFLTLSGHETRIARPVAEAVPLFWRFAVEEFGITAPLR